MAKDFNQLFGDLRIFALDIKTIQQQTPKMVGIKAKKAIKENFAISGYDTGTGVNKWKARAESTNRHYDALNRAGRKRGYKGFMYKSSNPILLQSQSLKRSINYVVSGLRVKVGVMADYVGAYKIVPINYAKRHNEGLKGMPIRQFMPTPAQGMNAKIKKEIDKTINQQFKTSLKRFK